ncbi:MAG: type II secretion system major pseudopilin GspG [Candidatus Hydrogenedentales bacterium]|jgi:general secretion pathway protein G
MNEKSGFTLIELLLVMVIISILAGAVAFSVTGRSTQARRTRAQADLSTYQRAIEAFGLEHNDKYPKTLDDLATPDAKTGIKYIEKIKNDPWTNPYVFNVPGKANKYDLFSRGPDGQSGTDDDISVWDIE